MTTEPNVFIFISALIIIFICAVVFWLLDTSKCPKCKTKLSDSNRYKLEEYGYCNCETCDTKISDYWR